MMFLNSFKFSFKDYTRSVRKMTVFDTFYPINVLQKLGSPYIRFAPVTILYGGNGSGKSTLLNIIAEKIGASKRNINDLGPLFKETVDECYGEWKTRPFEIKLIQSDDVFDMQLDKRANNSNINRQKDLLIQEYFEYRNRASSEFYNDYEQMSNKIDANKMTASGYVRTKLRNKNISQQSNGQEALDYWQDMIQENGLYLIDEPENSLSAENQLKLKQYIEESARFFHCQFIIASHSPFFLSINEATIYDLDSENVSVPKKWTELDNMKAYYQLFKENWKE